jgi:hypothetical protein
MPDTGRTGMALSMVYLGDGAAQTWLIASRRDLDVDIA